MNKRELLMPAILVTVITFALALLTKSAGYLSVLSPVIVLSAYFLDTRAFSTITGASGVATVFYFTVIEQDKNANLGIYISIGIAVIASLLLKRIESEEDEVHKETKLRSEKLYDKTIRDGLTGLYNHDYLFEKIDDWTKKTNKVCVSVIDLDHFKSVNDTYGHEFGNVVLLRLSKILKEVENEDIIAARYGGEEFSLLFKNYSEREVASTLNALRERMANMRFRENRENPSFKITFSCGVTNYSKGMNAGEFFSRADKALYEAKENGRNMVITDF